MAPSPSIAPADPKSTTDQKTIPKRLADAFEAATGHRRTFSYTDKGDVIQTRPVRIVSMSFGPVLLTEQTIVDGCHACVGAVGVHYLRENGGNFRIVDSWPRAVEGWTWGLPPTDWNVTNKFTAYPAIHATGGFLAQGIMTSGATITELRPTGPAISDLIGTLYDDSGSGEEGKKDCTVTGRIANILKDRSFDVIVTGNIEAVDRYVKKEGRFVARQRIKWDLPCGYQDTPRLR